MNQDFLTALLDAYTESEQEITAIVTRQLAEGIDDEATWARLKLQNLKQLRQSILVILTRLKDLDDKAKQEVIKTFLLGNTSQAFLQTNQGTISALILDYTKKLQNSRLQILRQSEDIYRKVIYEVVAKSATGTQTRIQTARNKVSQYKDMIDLVVTDYDLIRKPIRENNISPR